MRKPVRPFQSFHIALRRSRFHGSRQTASAEVDNSPSYEYTSLLQSNDDDFSATKGPNHSHVSRSTTGPRNIRLLRLEPGSGSDPIVCGLLKVPISNLPKFEAISYSWGNTNGERTIICSPRETLKITKNLYSALWNLRLRDQPRLLWADAICINQQDPAEQSDQVKMMGDIYSRARRVLIWLGEDGSQHASEIFELVDWLVQQFPDNEIGRCTSPQSIRHLFRARLQRVCKEEPFQSFKWEKFQYLFQNPWFERIWIVQEALKATEATVIWGRRDMEWTALCFFFYAMTYSGFNSRITSVFTTSDSVRFSNLHILQALSSAALITILGTTRNFKSTDPRDKLYAVYGLANDQSEYESNIDYNVEPADVFTRFVISDVLERKNLRYLCFTSHRSSASGLILPSWVPDWSRTLHQVPFATFCGARVDIEPNLSFEASAGLLAEATVSLDSKVLNVRGKLVDELFVVAQHFLPNELPKRDGKLKILTDLVQFQNDSHESQSALGMYLEQEAKNMQVVSTWLSECHRLASIESTTADSDVFASERGTNF